MHWRLDENTELDSSLGNPDPTWSKFYKRRPAEEKDMFVYYYRGPA